MKVLMYPKNIPDFSLALKLDYSEFKCKCINKDCTYTLVNPKSMGSFSLLREKWGDSIQVNSGFRCQKHNSSVGGSSDSFHKKGSAMDLVPKNGKLLDLYDLAVKYFDVVILYKDKGFIHCHNLGSE